MSALDTDKIHADEFADKVVGALEILGNGCRDFFPAMAQNFGSASDLTRNHLFDLNVSYSKRCQA